MKSNLNIFRFLALSIALLVLAGAARDLGLTSDTTFSAQAQTIATVNAASYATDQRVTAGSIAAGFGTFNTTNNQFFSATTTPLPTTLGGVTLRVNNIAAGLFFTSTGQINYEIPPSLAAGTYNVVVTNANNTTTNGTLNVVAAAPGIFTFNASGTGVASALATFDGISYQVAFTPGGAEN
ncbi:MAG: hypothetical protein ACKV2V_18370, partial [Blastocatellia bacterium]